MDIKRPAIDELIPYMKKALPDVNFDASKITPNTRIHEDLGIDSLQIMTIAVLLTDDYNVMLNPHRPVKTIDDLLKCIEKR